MTTETFTTETRTLADYGFRSPLHDAASGSVLADADGKLDQPSEYRVLEVIGDADQKFLMVIGPSGNIDIAVDDATGRSITRDVGSDTDLESFATRYAGAFEESD